MSGRIQKRGACPVCGRLQAINAGGRVADHGYVVRHGATWNDCPGSRAPHFGIEAGRDWLAKTIARWSELLVAREARLAELVAEPAANAALKPVQRDIANYQLSIELCRKRLACWQPAAPVEVILETKQATVHLAWKVYGHSAALCCSSAMGAIRFRGPTTTVESEVTCPRCLKRLEARAKRKGGGA